MSDESKENKNNETSETPTEKQYTKAEEKAIEKIHIVKKVREITGGDGKWTLTQQIMQEVVATHIVSNPGQPLPKTPALVEALKIAIEEKYKDDEDLKQLLLSSIPAQNQRIRDWQKKEGWNEAVWAKIRDNGLFSKERRAAMIQALYERGLQRDTVAAKIYLQMSGDFVEKSEVTSKDSTIDKFREINSILHNKKRKAED